MKNEKLTFQDISGDIINLLLYENTILRKKQKNLKLSDKERIFDEFIIPPSLVIRSILKGEKK